MAIFFWTTHSYPVFSFYAVLWSKSALDACKPAMNFQTFILLWQMPGKGDFESFSVKTPIDFKILLADPYSFTWIRKKQKV